MATTALSLGLEAGIRYAQQNVGERRRLGRIARAHTAAELAELMAGTQVEPPEPESRVAYWSGFAHGVRQFLQEEARA